MFQMVDGYSVKKTRERLTREIKREVQKEVRAEVRKEVIAEVREEVRAEVTTEYEEKRKKEKEEMAMNLLKLGMNIKDISKVTGMSLQGLNKIKSNLSD